MKYRSITAGVCLGCSLWAVFSPAEAAVPTTYTNNNFLSSEHDKPAVFSRDQQGNFSGVTESGKSFAQHTVNNTLSIRLQRFSIDQAFFYVSDRGVIWADTDTAALSIYLTRIA